MERKAAYDLLTEHGVKPSVQRLAVMEYLLTHRTHPTADEIHSALIHTIPTLSKTTVYNTLKLFVEHKAAIMLTIDERNAKFDVDTKDHAHFLCKKCSRVYDLPIDVLHLAQSTKVPDGFRIEEVDLYLRGICKACSAS